MMTPPYPLLPEPMKKSWLERHPLWKIPLGCITLLLLMVLFGGGVVTAVLTSFCSSDVYREAVSRATSNAQVREALGEPINAGWFVSGQLNTNRSTGDASLSIPISGPKAKGVIRAVARKASVWRFTCLEVSVVGRGEQIDLLSLEPALQRNF